MPPRKILEFRTSEIASAGFSGQVIVAKIVHISSIQEVLSLLFTRSRADPFARSANFKLRQANDRAQVKVARARARVCLLFTRSRADPFARSANLKL